MAMSPRIEGGLFESLLKEQISERPIHYFIVKLPEESEVLDIARFDELAENLVSGGFRHSSFPEVKFIVTEGSMYVFPGRVNHHVFLTQAIEGFSQYPVCAGRIVYSFTGEESIENRLIDAKSISLQQSNILEVEASQLFARAKLLPLLGNNFSI